MMNLGRTLKYNAIQFTRSSKSTGILLIVCTVFSLLVTNLPDGKDFIVFWERKNPILEHLRLPANLQEWVNDGLMALFFLTAGMEIKRELLDGELKSLKRAVLPVFAAIGGVIAPAVIFTLFCKGTPFAHGWGIPTATDIAFSIGIMSMLGRHYVPEPLKVLLTALAIIDDLIAILIVAFFYGTAIQVLWLAAAAGISVLIYFLYKKWPFTDWLHCLLGIGLWYAMFRSGIHATVAGVVFGFLVPLGAMETLENKLHLPVNFFIIPLFAIANTCIPFDVRAADIFGHRLFWGISVGLFLGKVLGISLVSWLLIKVKWAVLPTHTRWYQFIGAGILAGIGFTMSIFISTLAYDNEEWQNISKIAVLAGSLLSMVTGYCWLRWQKISVKTEGRK